MRIFLAAALERAIRNAGVPVISVSMPADEHDKSGYKVHPPSLQAAAQPTIDAFNPDDAEHVLADADLRTDAQLASVSDDLLTALIEHWPAMQAEAQAGTLKGNLSTWKQRIRGRVKVLRRAK